MPTKEDILKRIKEMVEFVKKFNSLEDFISRLSYDYYHNKIDNDYLSILGEEGMEAYNLLSNPALYIENQKKHIKESEELKNIALTYADELELGHDFNYRNVEDLDKLYDYLEKSQEELIDEDFIEKNEKETKENLYYLENEQEFKNLESNQEYDESKAKEIKKALSFRKTEYSSRLEKLETPIENSTYLYSAKEVYKMLDEKPQYKYLFDESKISVQYLAEKENIFCRDIIKKYEYKIDDNNKKAITEIINMLIKYKFLDGVNMSDEEQTKVYGLRKILEKRNEIEDSVSKNNFNEAYEKTLEYNESIKNMKEIYDYARSTLPQDGKHVPGNVSCLRTAFLPEELVIDAQVHSQVNGIYNLVGFCRSRNYDPIDFVNNPQKYQDKMKEEAYNNFKNNFNASKETSLKQKGKAMSNLSQFLMHKTQGENRAFESILCFETNPVNVENNAILKEINAQIANNYGEYPGSTPFNKKINEVLYVDFEQIRNYMAGGEFYDITDFMPNGYNIITGEDNRSNFNYEEFLANDTRSTSEIFASVIDRLASGVYEASVTINNHEYGVDGTINFDSLVVGAKIYLSDLLAREKAKENPDKCGINFINNFLFNPAKVVLKYTTSKYKNELENEVDGISEITTVCSPGGFENELLKCDVAINNSYDIDTEEALTNAIDETATTSSKDLKETFNEYLDKDDYVKFGKENTMKIMAIGYEVYDRYRVKNIFQRWLTPDGWRERSIINNLKKAFEKRGINQETFESIFLADDSEKQEWLIKASALIDNKDIVDKFKNLKNSINAKEVTNENKQEIFKDSIEELRKIDTYIHMGFAQEKDINKLKAIQTEAINLLVEKGVDKAILDNELGAEIEKKDKKVPVFSSDKELNKNEKEVELSKGIKIEDPTERLEKQLNNPSKEKE